MDMKSKFALNTFSYLKPVERKIMDQITGGWKMRDQYKIS